MATTSSWTLTVSMRKWAAQILTQVPKRAHFLLLLTLGALDRCADENDWVRHEFLLVLERGRKPGGRFRRARRPRRASALREYFATQLRRQQPEAWRAATGGCTSRCATTKDLPQPTLADLQPLYQAVAYDCQAGLQQEASAEVYIARIRQELWGILVFAKLAFAQKTWL